jgi:twitching motility protein PilT
MAKIDVYLRSIEKFGATGAILTSGQPITLRFPQGDRNATQVTPHDQLVGIVREVAPPGALDQIDSNRPASFDVDSAGTRYRLDVSPRPGEWQVTISGAAAPAAAVQHTTRIPSRPATNPGMPAAAPAAAPITDAGEMLIERGQYSDVAASTPRSVGASASGTLDQLTMAARSARATDVYISTGAAPMARVNGELQQVGDRGALDAETIARELGVVAPAEARAAWTEGGAAVFTYSDGIGRVRATLSRDHRGPGATLRLLVGEPPAIERLGIGPQVGPWLEAHGLVLVAGPSGAGKTTALAALVRSLGDRQRRVITFEDPIEIVATSTWVSQRALGEHVPTVTVGVASAMREGADAIVVGGVTTADSALAVLDAVSAGHLVLAAISAPTARQAADRFVDLLPHDRRDVARGTLSSGLLGVIGPVVKGGSRSFEVVAGRGG